MQSEDRLRVFFSYSHEDKDLASSLVEALREHGLDVHWDVDLPVGQHFVKSIVEGIEHAHLLIPLVTENSNGQAWVHEEIGYGTALEIPVLPIAVGQDPSALAADIQAVKVDADLSGFEAQLQKANLRSIVLERAGGRMRVELATYPEQRTELMTRKAKELWNRGTPVLLRKRSAQSCFGIPDRPPWDDEAWTGYAGDKELSELRRQMLRNERRAMEKHAREAGCKLLLHGGFAERSLLPAQWAYRVKTLIASLERLPAGKVQVAFLDTQPSGTYTLLGNWYAAESLAHYPDGFRGTMVTAHGPTVLQKVEEYDRAFRDACDGNPLSTEEAVEVLRGLLEQVQGQ